MKSIFNVNALATGEWRPRLRRALCTLTAVLMLAGLVPLASAEGSPAVSLDAAAPQDTWFQSAVMHEGNLLLYSGEGLFIYRPGEEAIELLAEITPKGLEEAGLPPYMRLFGDGQRIYALEGNEEGMQLIPVVLSEEGIKAGDKPLKLSWGEAQKRVLVDDHAHMPNSAVILGDQVHLLFQVWGSREQDQFILSYELKDGAQPRIREAKHVIWMVPHQENSLLTLVMDEANAWDEANRQMRAPELAVFSLEDDSIKSLGTTGRPLRHDEALLYEAETDTIYMTGNAELLRKVAGGEFEVCAYLNASHGFRMMGGSLFLLEPGKVMAVGSQEVSIRTTDPSQLPAVRLNVYGSWLDDAAKKAIGEMGSVSVRFLDSQHYPTAQEFGQALLGGEEQIDLFFLDSEYMDLNALQQKGYCLDLSGSQSLNDYAGRLYPELEALGRQDGRLTMVPVHISAYMFGYHPKVFNAMELEAPRTFFDLCDLIERWNDDLADEHADFTPFRSPQIKSQMAFIALLMYADAAQQQGEEFSFTAPLLKRMLERVENLRTDNLGMNVNFESANAEKEMQELYNKVSMVEEHFDLSLYNIKYMQDAMEHPALVSSERSGVRMPLVMTADEGIPFNVALQTRMGAVSAKSQHPEEAARYLELYVKHLPPQQQAAMMPGMDDAIADPNYERHMKYMDNHLETLQAAVDKAEGAEKTELEGNLKKYEETVAAEKARRKFLVTEESVKLYRELMANRYVTHPGSLRRVLNDENIQQSLSRYLQGQMPLDQFLQEAEGKLRLMRLENE